MTRARRLVIRVLSESEDHPDVKQIFQRALAIDPEISVPTIYRTVNLLEDTGVLERHHFGNAKAHYELATGDEHDHLVDVDSGDVIEFQDPEIERLKIAIGERLGYKVLGHRLQLYGTKAAGHTDNNQKEKAL